MPQNKITSFFVSTNPKIQLDQKHSPIIKKIKIEEKIKTQVEDIKYDDNISLKDIIYDPTDSDYDYVNNASWATNQSVPYSALAKTLEAIEEESSRLKIIEYLSHLYGSIIELTPQDLIPVLYLCSNCIAPTYEGRELNIGEQAVLKLMAESTGRTLATIKNEIKAKGDIGIVAQQSKGTQKTMFSNTKKHLTVRKVYDAFKEISEISGQNSQSRKLGKLKEIFVHSQSYEAKYIVRFVTGKMRIGLAQASILAALSQAFTESKNKKKIDENTAILKNAFNECPSYDIIIPLIMKHGISNLMKHCKMHPGIPVKPMLAQPTKGDVKDLLEKFESGSKSKGEDKFLAEPLTFEWKYDGERAQIHLCSDGTYRVYSRNQEDTTTKYPDLIEKLQWEREISDRESNTHNNRGIIYDKTNVKNFIMDAEVVAFDAEKQQILPFQILTTRKRKDASSHAIKVDVCVFAFDLLFLNDSPLTELTFKKRREILYTNFNAHLGHFHFAQHLDVEKDSPAVLDEIAEFMEASVKGNCEGLMVKALDSLYEIDKRSNKWLKLKKDYIDSTGDTFDLVIIGAYQGQGKRTGVYGGLLLACYDDANEQYQSICKLGTGFKDADLEELRDKLKPHIISGPKSYYVSGYNGIDGSNVGGPDVWFDPVLVCEVKAADLSLSPVHKAAVGIVDDFKGISLRFPRYIKLRDDKSAEQATTATQIAQSYQDQEQIKNQQTIKKSPAQKQKLDDDED